MTDKIIRVKIDAGDSAAQINQLDKSMVGLGQSADIATKEIDQLNGINTQVTKTAAAVSQATGRMGQVAQQAGYQIQDFANQVAGGQSAMLAFGQQAPQLFSTFGVGGAVFGAIIAVSAAIGGTLVNAIKTAKNEANELPPAIKKFAEELEKKFSAVDQANRADLARVEIGKLNTEYEKSVEALKRLKDEEKDLAIYGAASKYVKSGEQLTKAIYENSLAIKDQAANVEDLKKKLSLVNDISQQGLGTTSLDQLSESSVKAADDSEQLTQQLKLQIIALEQGEKAAVLQATAWRLGKESISELDAATVQQINRIYQLKDAQEAQKESQAALTAEINAEAAAWAKQSEQDQRNAERARRDQERIDQRLANMRLETQTMASEAALQKAVRDEVFTQEEADLAARTSARLLAATTEYQQLMELDNISNAQKIEAKIAYEEQIAAINAEYAQRGYDLEVSRQMMATETAQRIRDANLQAMSSGVSILETFLGRSNAIVKAARIAMGAYQAFSIYASSTAAAAAALAPPPLGLGPIAGAGLAASIKTAGSVSAAAVLASSVASTFSGGGGSASFGGGSIATSAPTLPTTPQAAAQVGSFEISGLSALTDELRRRDPDEQLPVAFVRRIVASLESVQRLQGA